MAARRDPWSARLVAAQFAFAVILLGGGGLLVQRYGALLMDDGVIDAGRYVTAGVVPPDASYPPGDGRADFYTQLEPRLAAVPGVERVAFASVTPFLPAPTRPIAIRATDTEGDRALNAQLVAVSPGYFETLGLPLLRGRSFDTVDGVPASNVAIVNALFAERHFPDGDPIGRQIRIETPADAPDAGAAAPGNGPWLTVIGVAPTIRQTVASAPRPLVYVPHDGASASSAQVILRMPMQSAGTVAAVRAAVAALDEDVLLLNIRPLTEPLRNSRLQPQLIATVLGSLAFVALFLSAVGLYAIASHGVRQRTAEIGLRLALGGRPAQIVWLFVRRGLAPVAAGLCVGLAGAFGVGQLLRSRLVGTSAADPATFAVLIALLACVTAAACFVPAWRGTRVDPASTLRQD